MSRPVFLNEQRILSASGTTEQLLRDYAEARSPLRRHSWRSAKGTKEVTLGQLPPALLGGLSDAWESPLRPRWETALALLLAELGATLVDRAFDAVLVGRQRLGNLHPAFFAARSTEAVSAAEFSEWLRGAMGKAGLTAGRILSVDASCASGTTILSQARQRIAAGSWRRALLLAFDPVTPLGMSLLESIGVTSPSGTPRVFHPERDGFVRAEAFCAAVVSDRHELAGREAVRVAHVALSNDSAGLTGIEDGADQLRRSIEECIAGVDPAGAFVKAHGTGTRMNDLAESTALARAAGGRWAEAPVVGFKSQFGHTMNAGGLFELALASDCLRRDRLEPVLHSLPQDPAIGLNVVHEPLHGSGLRRCLGLTLGFGGINSAYLLEKAPA